MSDTATGGLLPEKLRGWCGEIVVLSGLLPWYSNGRTPGTCLLLRVDAIRKEGGALDPKWDFIPADVDQRLHRPSESCSVTVLFDGTLLRCEVREGHIALLDP
jgi:hypothetical protein